MKPIIQSAALFALACASPASAKMSDDQMKEELGAVVREMLDLREKAETDPAARRRRDVLKPRGDELMNALTGGDHSREAAITKVLERLEPPENGNR